MVTIALDREKGTVPILLPAIAAMVPAPQKGDSRRQICSAL
jgi:hypothetical protein